MKNCLSLLLLAASLPALAQQQITWLMPELQASASPTRQGMAQPVADYLRRHWGGDTQHVVELTNAKRAWVALQGGESVCHLMMLHTPEREARAYFVDTHLLPPAQFVVREDRVGQLPLNARGEVDLKQLWRDTRLRGVLVSGRSYGAGLDQLLALRPSGTMQALTVTDFGAGLLQMLSLNRADYTLEYDFTVMLMRQRVPALQQLRMLPIAGQDEMLRSGVACPRTAWGRATIARVDELINSPAGRQLLRGMVPDWLSPEASKRYGDRIAAFYADPGAKPGALKPPGPARPAPPPR